MPRAMPPLHKKFIVEIDKALSLAEAGEIIKSSYRIGDIAWDQLYTSRLEAIYELAFLRIFIFWELFVEDSFTRYICGYISPGWRPALINLPFKTINQAEQNILGAQHYVSWGPSHTISRSKKYLNQGLHESVIASNQTRLEWFVAIRNRIAHKSKSSKSKFNMGTMKLAGRRYFGSSPGRFLRDWDQTITPTRRWLHSIGTEFKNLAPR